MKTGALERAIWRVKDGNWAWGLIFARVVLGFLYHNPSVVQRTDAIIPMPAILPDGVDPRTDHARWVIQQAAEQDERSLPFVLDPPLILKTRPTPRMREATGAAERRRIAHEIFQALEIRDPAQVRGKRIMVYDDVFTSGHTLNAVARRLKLAGAAEVYGLTLARQPWGSQS